MFMFLQWAENNPQDYKKHFWAEGLSNLAVEQLPSLYKVLGSPLSILKYSDICSFILWPNYRSIRYPEKLHIIKAIHCWTGESALVWQQFNAGLIQAISFSVGYRDFCYIDSCSDSWKSQDLIAAVLPPYLEWPMWRTHMYLSLQYCMNVTSRVVSIHLVLQDRQ